MATKKELIQKLKLVKKGQATLTPVECDNLILLLGGIVRPRAAPKKPERPYNWAAICSVVFGFMENAEQLAWIESEQKAGTDPRLIAYELHGCYASTQQAIDWLKQYKEAMRPISAKNRTMAEHMAADWFKQRGIKLGIGSSSVKFINNQLTAIQNAARLNQLQLDEWRTLDPMRESIRRLPYRTRK